jgi:hypothetical protein
MTNQHPLTDEICDQIQDSIHPCDPENMRPQQQEDNQCSPGISKSYKLKSNATLTPIVSSPRCVHNNRRKI